MKISNKFKNLKILSFIVFVFLNFIVVDFSFARIEPYSTPSSCLKDSQCSSLHGDGSCCMADIYSNDSLYNYYVCISTSKTISSCPAYSGVVSNKCWPKDVCTNGLDFAISGIVSINGECGSAVGLSSITSSQITTLKASNQFCSSGTIGTSEPKLNNLNKTWSWTCYGQNNGKNITCSAKYSETQNSKINGVCYNYSSPLASEPTKLCVSGDSGVVNLNDGVFSWTCLGKSGGADASCTADAKIIKIVSSPEINPFESIVNDPLVKPSSSSTGSNNSGIVSSYPTIEQKPANISSYNLLEKYTSPCSIKFDSECEVLDQKFLDAIKAGASIQEAISSGKINGDIRVARLDYSVTPPKELDNYKTGLTLTNIQKLRKARILPVGMELAALCIAGQIPCSNGYIYDGGTDQTNCSTLTGVENCHQSKGGLGDITLNRIINGYSACDPLTSNSSAYSKNNDPFCHLVNPNWILKDPKYMCESGIKNGQLLYVTDKQSQSNIRYESCPDVSTCLSEKDNGDCKAYGYCLREKNIWRFDLSADSCFSQNVGCTQYTYTMGGTKTTLGFIKETTDTSVCDQGNAGCRKYSLVKTGNSPTDWSYDDSNKIYLNNKITACDSSQEGCTAFIRRDSANLVKNSSFEDYILSSDFTTKNALFWSPYVLDTDHDSISIQTTNDGVPVFDGSNSLAMKRTFDSDVSSFVSYNLSKDYLIDVQPNKTYTLSYYILGYNFSFTSDELSKYSTGAFVNAKEYNRNKNLISKKTCVAGSTNSLGNICSANADCGTNGVCSSSASSNIIDIESFRYVNNFISSTWTRKSISFKTGLDTYFIDIIPVLSRIKASSNNPITVVFDAIQLQEGGKSTAYVLYENSSVNYLKKAPEYSNCYSTSSDKDKIFCSNFIKSCDAKDVGCRRYEKKDNSDYWLPGKPNEENYCTAECKGYQLYRESGPSYDYINGSSFQSLISSTAKSCSSSASGCSQYKNLSNGNNEYFSNIKACVKETDNIGTCNNSPFTGKMCLSDSDCGSVTNACVKAKAQYADYFTYTGSETSGYKLNVYRLLRTKACSNNYKQCSSDSECGSNATCGYYSDIFAPAIVNNTNTFDVCDANAYKKANHNPDCREFHGPKDEASASGGSDGDYVLYYANMSNVVPVSDKDCSYYSIVPYQESITRVKCDSISKLSPSIRYIDSTNTCNVGVYIPDSTVCGSESLNCREYNGTSISSETLFTDNFEGNDTGEWVKNSSGVIDFSMESIFVNEHSVKITYPEYISKIVAPEIINPTEKALYKLRLYAKNDSSTGTLSAIRLRVGGTFSSVKQVSNDWKFVSFDIFSSSDLTTALNSIQIINDGLVAGNKAVNLYVDYISIEKSSSVYVIKDSWKTPVSCDNSIDNPTGVCNTEYEALGFCSMQPNKVCLTGDNAGAFCTSALDCSSDNTDKGDTCDYPNKVCRWGDNKNSSCYSDDDCYNNPNDANNINAKVGSCFYTTNGYRLELGKMIGCDEYVDSYNNNEFYVFNDLNLCSAEKMGCEALYDTKNSKSYQKQEFNQNIDYSNIVSYYTFDDKNYVSKNDYSGAIITNQNNVAYVKDGVSSGAALFSGSNSISEPISNDLKKVSSNISIYGWVKPTSFGNNRSVVSLGSYYDLSMLSDGQVRCRFNNNSSLSLDSGSNHKLVTNKWQNILCTYDGDRIKIFIDGEFVASSSDVIINLNYDADTTSVLRIGSGFVGSIDDLRIYSKFFDSQSAYNSFSDYSDNYTVPADELGYYIIDNKYSCESKYKGCMAVGRNEDRYDSKDFSYSTAYYIVDPDKFKSSGNYSTTGVYDATMCTFAEEGCYNFADSKNSSANFKFPRNLCVYKANVDVGVSDTATGNPLLQSGWFKYDVKSKTISNVGCYLNDVIKSGISEDSAKINPASYRIVKSSDCEYRKDPVVVRRTFEGVCKTSPSDSCLKDSDCPNYSIGSCDLSKYISRPKQTTYYLYTGSCSDDASKSCSDDYMCNSGYCILERTNSKCSPSSGDLYCKPYGYDENSGVIDQFSNKPIEFKVCQGGTKVGSYCKTNSDCPLSSCGGPWSVSGWFKKNSTKGCSDDGDNIVEDSDYFRDYNSSVGVCNEYGCTNFIEPTEKRCTNGSLFGFQCDSDNDCGNYGVCVTDELNGSKYCDAKSCSNNNECGGIVNSQNTCVSGKCVTSIVNKINQSCHFDKDCGFSGVCTGNNIYSYINNSKISGSSCNGKVSRESGCILFNDTSSSQLKFSSTLTYANVKNGVAVAAVTGDNSGGDSQKDANVIIKVSRDRECAEWLTFDKGGSPVKQNYDAKTDNSGVLYPTCTKLSEDNKCNSVSFGSGWNKSLNVGYYISEMNGDWFNQDFSGFAIPNNFSINTKVGNDYWWTDSASGSTAFLAGKTSDSNNVVCKAYPETDSPFNFSDKFNVKTYKCSCTPGGDGLVVGQECSVNNSGSEWCVLIDDELHYVLVSDSLTGKLSAISYNDFKAIAPRDYFKNVSSGITIPYDNSDGKALVRVDDNQDCYYQKVNYKDVLTPKEQYFGKGQGVLPSSVCYSANSGVVVGDNNVCDTRTYNPSGLSSKIANYTDTNLKYKGYCAEYDYSHEIYYSGSGKYNCITWIPGFISE